MLEESNIQRQKAFFKMRISFENH